MVKSFILSAVACLLLASISTSAYAEGGKVTLPQVEKYLNSFKTLKSAFRQTAGSSAVLSRGMIYIQRPNQARWEYFEPKELLAVVDDGRLRFWDRDLDQTAHIGIESHPLALILKSNIRLNKDIKVTEFQQDKTTIWLGLAPMGKGKNYGALQFVFSKLAGGDLTLRRVRRREGRQTITMELINAGLDVSLPSDMFKWKNPKFNKNQRFPYENPKARKSKKAKRSYNFQ